MHLSSHHHDKYGDSSKEGGSQHKADSFVDAKKCPAESAEEITRRIAEMVARDLWPISIVEGVHGFQAPIKLHEARVSCSFIYTLVLNQIIASRCI